MGHYLYVGTYTGGRLSDHKDTGSGGIYCFRMDALTGELSARRCFGQNEIDPGFLAVKGNLLLAENERKDVGTVRSFRILADGSLQFADRVETEDSKCAFLSTDAFGSYIFATNYASGSLMLIRHDGNGGLELVDRVQHYGRSVVPVRQDSPRAHSVKQTPDGDGLIVPDLGMDKIMKYRLDRQTEKIYPDPEQPFVEVEPGEGPRHMVFTPDGKYIYVNTEIGNHIYAYAYDGVSRRMEQIQKISLLPEVFDGKSFCSEILISSDGRFVYVGNRGYDTIAVFAVDAQTGHLTPVGQYASGGIGPRHMCLGPSEDYLICANKDSDSIVVLERSRQTGELGRVIYRCEVPAPSCVVWKEI